MATTITKFSPKTGVSGGTINITGVGFTGASVVKFGAQNAQSFIVVSDTLITAVVAAGDTGQITVISPSGTAILAGFIFSPIKVKLKGLPLLGRNAVAGDLMYYWDSARGILCQGDVSLLPQPGGPSGNIYTALGSPFKVRQIGATWDAANKITTIQDLRLIGKNDYVVNATDVNSEFENYIPAATATGITSATDGTFTNQAAVNITGTGTGATFTIRTLSKKVVQITPITLGSGYVIGDTFSIASLPGFTFTVQRINGNYGNLEYDSINGILTIHNYHLQTDKHITIYADGVVSTDLQNYLISVKSDIDTFKLICKPLILKGAVWPWKQAANLIPPGWQECLDMRGKTFMGQDPTDVYDVATNPSGLSLDIGTIIGSKTYKLVEGDLPPLELPVDHSLQLSATVGGGFVGGGVLAPYEGAGGQGKARLVNANQKSLILLNPARIVQWIEYVGI